MFEMLVDLKLPSSVYFVADKYYCSGRFIKGLIDSGVHIITMMKKNAVAYYAPEVESKRRGRPRRYGKRVKLFDLFNTDLNFISAPMPGNDKITIEYCAIELFWKPLGELAKFVLMRHPEKGNSIPMSTDLTLDPMDIISGYSLRFKIEVMFKQAVHQIGTFMYRFWLKAMLPRKRGSGDCDLQFAPVDFKEKVLHKLNAYHIFMQLGFIAQGLIQYLSIHHHQIIWRNFGTWLRTIKANTLPSEKVVSLSLGRRYIEFLIDDTMHVIFKKFLRRRTDIGQFCQYNLDQKQAA